MKTTSGLNGQVYMVTLWIKYVDNPVDEKSAKCKNGCNMTNVDFNELSTGKG